MKKVILIILSILFLGMGWFPTTTIPVPKTTTISKTTTTVTKTTTTSVKSNVTAYGLGTVESTYKANNRSYEWYIDQGNTGKYSGDNCGPASVTMTMKWQNNLFNKTTEDARTIYRPNGGWWYTDDVINYLKMYFVPSYVTDQIEDADIKAILNSGSIVIVCIDFSKVRRNSNQEQHVDRFDSKNVTGHFIVLKGYRIVDNFLFYESYDPFSMNLKYLDGAKKGKDRYYRAVDIWTAMKTWWTYAIVINSGITKAEVVKSVDPTKIPHASGQ